MLEPARAPRAGASSRAIALAGFHGFLLANPLGQAHWVCMSIAGFGTGSIRAGY